jgi:penicillin-binding protein 1A
MKRLRWVLVLAVLALAVGAGAFGFTLYDQYWTQLPPISRLLEYDPPVATRVYANDGSLVGEYFFEKRYLTPIEDIPPVVRHAFVAAEDADFYSHRGIDPISIVRAFLVNLRAGDVVQGGSTITQQVVKALLLSPERSYRRKLREIMLSIKLERELTKDEILFLYLNQIYLGDGNYGVGAAARSYFGKDVSELTAPEAALLAGLPKAPSRYSPTHNPEGALSRQRYVLRRMQEDGFISMAEYRSALRAGLSILGHHKEEAKVGSYYTEYIRRYLEERFGTQALYKDGFSVYTSINLDMQKMAEDAVRRGVEDLDVSLLGYLGPIDHLEGGALEKFRTAARENDALVELHDGTNYKGVVTAVDGKAIDVELGTHTATIDVSKLNWHSDVERSKRRFRAGDVVELTPVDVEGGRSLALVQTPQVEAALIALDPHTGEVKAMVGGYDFSRSQFNRAMQASRQPGSAFKPLVYAAALDNGYTPASIILDAPIQYVDHDEIWRPQNYSRRFYGPTTLRRALEKSRNVVTVRVVQDLGPDTVVDYVSRFGFTTPIHRTLSVGLGTSEVSLVELASAYSTFANNGVEVRPLFITRVEDANGHPIEESRPERTQVMSPQTAYLITSMLEGVVQNGTGRSVKKLGRPVAGKTGTTNDQHDAWFMGFTPDLLTGVWVGYDDHRTLGPRGTGGRVAAPIWLDFMQQAMKGRPVADFQIPLGISCVLIDPDTGKRAGEDTTNAYLECFKNGTEPQETAPAWRYDPALGAETMATEPAPGHEGGGSLPVEQAQPVEGSQIFQ